MNNEIATPVRVEEDVHGNTTKYYIYSVVDNNDQVICTLTEKSVADQLADALNTQVEKS